jgi:hypothetical protein
VDLQGKQLQSEASVMLLLGLVLAAATAAFIVLLIAYNLSGGPSYTVKMFGGDLVVVDHLTAFLAGIALTLVFGLGLAIAAAGLARHRRRRTHLRAARREADIATAERDALAARLDEHGMSSDPPMAGSSGAHPAGRHHRLHLFGH